MAATVVSAKLLGLHPTTRVPPNLLGNLDIWVEAGTHQHSKGNPAPDVATLGCSPIFQLIELARAEVGGLKLEPSPYNKACKSQVFWYVQ